MKYCIILSFLALSISCNKNTGCEQWEYYDECTAKTEKTCAHSRIYAKGIICGKEARQAKPGGTRVIVDDEFFLTIRHYQRKM